MTKQIKQLKNKKTAFGLYDPIYEKENCGFGLIANVNNCASHELVQTAIRSLCNLTHRGGLDALGTSGDGCGLLIKMPRAFMQGLAKAEGVTLPKNYAVGMIFFGKNNESVEKAKDCIDNELKKNNLETLFWRDVPVDSSILGESAQESEPIIKQVFVGGAEDLDSDKFNSLLFASKRFIEKQLDKADDNFYIASLHNDLISYKALVLPNELAQYYPDLNEENFESSSVSYHQRFSTNTLPEWRLAQPFRFLAHNGEINTIRGNRNWSRAREKLYQTAKIPNLPELQPVISATGSDSCSLDNMIEMLEIGGIDILTSIRMLLPPAWQNVNHFDDDLRAFFEYCSANIEPWDGPAAVVLNTGRFAVCALDRNGLRPTRYVLMKNGNITFSSEVGVYDYDPKDVVQKGSLKPGQLMAVDLKNKRLLTTENIDDQLKITAPFKEWVRDNVKELKTDSISELQLAQNYLTFDNETLLRYQKYFYVTFEEKDQIIKVLAELGQEAVGSMGDDTPLPVLSVNIRSLYDYFRQMFAQVTNPPIDPLREKIVMSLSTLIGPEHNVFERSPEHTKRIKLRSPILNPSELECLLNQSDADYSSKTFSLNYDHSACNLETAIKNLCSNIISAVKSNTTIVCLTDNNIDEKTVAIPALMATGAVHHALIREGIRYKANIIVETATARDPHHFAVLLGYGATAISPYLAFEVIKDMHLTSRDQVDLSLPKLLENYISGIEKGLLKIMSKMGISTVASYRGAQLFDVVGLSRSITELCFDGTHSSIGGCDFEPIELQQRKLAWEAFNPRKTIRMGGQLKYIHNGEDHAFNPDVVNSLRRAVSTGKQSDYKVFADLVNKRTVLTFRDMLELKTDNDNQESVPIEEVEDVKSIVRRFDTAGISLGALSPEAHEALAVAMNRLGSRSNSGEGAEDPDRYATEKMSKIKQVASGRFGVTPHYLVNAEVIQIKIAQGAKPGEGGQLPGHKVNATIAKLRHCEPGVTLISPPPHHDIYSIEDLAQLIFDLKQVNPQALVSVKLVAEPGVGTIAAGVAKAFADLITISGYDGGTGASPLTTVKYAGSPFEMGLVETHQTLRANGLRHKIRLQIDGGLKTGLDVVKAAILGAESFGFGTAPMIALGCKYLRICHLNTCAVGVATQNAKLRDEHFIGSPEMVINYFTFVAQEVRQLLAQLGFRKLEEIIGQTHLVGILDAQTKRQSGLDLTPILEDGGIAPSVPQFNTLPKNEPADKGELAKTILKDIEPSIVNNEDSTFNYTIRNTDRTIGAMAAGAIAKKYGNQGFDKNINLNFEGVAGQSFGAFNTRGLNLNLIGDANDYVGKGMAGGRIIIKPQKDIKFNPSKTPIVGNTCLYGATGGTLYAYGTAGERFAVRNSGATAVVEGIGDHGCEYMTGGTIVCLGKVGINFGAGMSGGTAFIFDQAGFLPSKLNLDMIEYQKMNAKDTYFFRAYLKNIITDYHKFTESALANKILENFEDSVNNFWLVKPKNMNLDKIIELYSKAA